MKKHTSTVVRYYKTNAAWFHVKNLTVYLYLVPPCMIMMHIWFQLLYDHEKVIGVLLS